MGLIVLTIAAALLAQFLVGRFTRWANHRIVDVPNARSSHAVPTPRGGGVVIVALVSLVLLAVSLLDGYPEAVWLVVAGVAVAGVSWYDDVHSIGTLPRFSVHFAAVAVALAVFWPPQLAAIPSGGVFVLPFAVAIAAALFWGIALTNVYNFMDGIDGIAGIQAVAAGIGWMVAGIMVGSSFLQVAGSVIIGSTIGFLFHNWSPAKVFMGDVGSVFLGFLFATLPLAAGDVADGRVPLAAVLFVWPFVFDGTYTIFRRILRKENIFQAHRSHLYQRLVIAGRSHAWVSLLFLAMALFSSSAGIAWLEFGRDAELLVSSVLVIVPVVLITATRISESRSETRAVLSEA